MAGARPFSGLSLVCLLAAASSMQLYKGHEGLVRCISVEPQGQWLASGELCSHK